jgi:hypothetical protein
MANPTQVAPFHWGEVELSQVVHVNGIPHSTRRAIGEFLEYADPQNAIDVILGRNPYIEEFSVPVKLTGTDGKNYDTKVYHPMGFLLIVMESGQPKAQATKIAIAAFVFHFCVFQALPFGEQIKVRQYKRQLLADLTSTKDAYIVRQLLEELDFCNRAIGLPPEQIKYLGKDYNQLLLEGF